MPAPDPQDAAASFRDAAPSDARRVDPETAGQVRALADATYDLVMQADPVEASLLGDHRFDTALPDRSAAGLRASGDQARRLRDRLAAVDTDRLPAADRATCDVVGHVLDEVLHDLEAGYVEFAAGPVVSGGTLGSAAADLLAAMPKLALGEPAHADAYLARCRAIPAHLADATDRLRDGVAHDRTPARRLVDATVRQIDRYLSTRIDDDPLLLAPPGDWSGARRWSGDLADVLADAVRPAFARHRAVLADVVVPRSRPDTAVGLGRLAGGDRSYRRAVTLHTTTDEGPEHWHRLGLALVTTLADEYAALGARVLGTDDVDAIFARLRTDPRLRFDDAGQIVTTARAALDRAQGALSAWVGAPSRRPCEVWPIPAVEAPESTIAYYHPPAVDGSRAGRYYVNTSAPHTRTRYEAEALAFHESVPGHHTQHAIGLDLDLPLLRRVTYITPYAEGWGLYAERLADEMGLYSDDTARLGMLSFDSWRACRLVVDTGMHAMGWSRDEAVAFMRTHSPQAYNNIENEVDRYIGWPGQALAYMSGRTRIAALRRRAEHALGDRFDVRAFHDVVLGHGAVPLWTLERVVGDWLVDRGAPPAASGDVP
jgi:uncharacterized protein (DUF885 family)